jgi:hypothetical protein
LTVLRALVGATHSLIQADVLLHNKFGEIREVVWLVRSLRIRSLLLD